MRIGRDTAVRALRDALWLAVVPYFWFVFALRWPSIGMDSAHAYWNAWSQGLYGAPPTSQDAYNYSPAFAQLIYPLTLLPWEAFLVLWSVLLCGALAWLLWPVDRRWRWLAFAYAAIPAVAIGNIEPLLAVSAVVGMRFPAAWAFPLLTKVTPGLGPVWFAVRREWRQAAAALGATLLIVGASALAAPGLWADWLSFLTDNAGTRSGYLPLWARLPVALAIVVWGAVKNRRGALAVGMLFAMPLWSGGVLILLAALPRLRRRLGQPPAPDSDGDVEGTRDVALDGRHGPLG